MGHVVFIGAGPGAADLITLRGAARLAQADVVLHDALTDPALKDMAPNARWIHVGKRGFKPDSMGQDEINRLLVENALAHAVVVRLKGGDPSIFGRLEEETDRSWLIFLLGLVLVLPVALGLATGARIGMPVSSPLAGIWGDFVASYWRAWFGGIGAWVLAMLTLSALTAATLAWNPVRMLIGHRARAAILPDALDPAVAAEDDYVPPRTKRGRGNAGVSILSVGSPLSLPVATA